VAERTAEARALAVPEPASIRTALRQLTEEPHVAGTPADRKTALFVRDKLREWGWTADLVEYEVLLDEPETGFDGKGGPSLKLVRPNAQELPVRETANAFDKDSASLEALPAFHGYGASGDVTGQVVYGNYGTIEDFEAVEKLGINVKDKIVLVRYGGLFRGLKVYNAQKRGAKGILIYSDPADDGFAKGDAYPNGPFRPASAIQRGSVQFLWHGPGDPSTPGTPSLKDGKRLPHDTFHGFPLRDADWEKQTGLKRDEYFATIPSLPISYEAAQPILENLAGPNVPSGAQGGLPLTYHVGPGPAEVHLVTSHHYELRTIWNVIARIDGTDDDGRWVMLGNHRDAWVYGAVDPGSGTAATLEACRAIGAAVKAGWKPKRTLMYASWDAEEYGLVGSTEWAEHHADDIGENGVMMFNVDSAVSGPTLDLDGIPSMRELVLQAMADIIDPHSSKTLKETWLARQKQEWQSHTTIELDEGIWEGQSEAVRQPVFFPQMTALGSGSDYTAFVDHLGVPAVDVNFGGRYGVYHSTFDDFYWMENFCDPDFVIHATAAKLYTLLAMRAAGADVVPFTFGPYGTAIRDHVDDLRRRIARKNLGDDPKREFPRLGDLAAAVREFQNKAKTLDEAIAKLTEQPAPKSSEALKALNKELTHVEREFLSADGLPGRKWFQHTLYAPGLTTGYASWPLPGVRQAIEDGDAKLLDAQVGVLIERIRGASARLKQSADAMNN
jgi:N-acetylated-alpha-linked acidic dipeptidase